MKQLNIGILGYGTVASGVMSLLKKNRDEFHRRTGCHININKVLVRSLDHTNPNNLPLTTNIEEIISDPTIDVVVELMGGISPTYEYLLKALNSDKHIVTANKALIATHGNHLFEIATQKGLMVLFEASVAGGVPIIKTLRESLIGNQIRWLSGIINGTGNFILTEMKEHNRNFKDALDDAQKLGYAEADPTFDIEGIDAAHKLTILTSIAFGIPLQFDKVFTEGISKIESVDIQFADQLGYIIKHLGIAKKRQDGIEMRVHPTLISKTELLSNVNGVMNAIYINGNATGSTLYYGAGAGSLSTASSVISDLADIVRMKNTSPEQFVPYLAFQNNKLSNVPILPQNSIQTAYYLRLEALDQTGVLKDISQILSQYNISIEQMLQTKSENSDLATIIMTTHKCDEASVLESIKQIENLPSINSQVTLLRIESFNDTE